MSDYIRQSGDLYIVVRKREGRWRWVLRSYAIAEWPWGQYVKMRGSERSMEKAIEVGLRARAKWMQRRS